MKTDRENAEIRERIRKGLELAFKKLVESKKRSNGIFVFSEGGLIRKVKASEL